MSVFTTARIPCPSCGVSLQLRIVQSVNADRRPDLRDAIVSGSFQRERCPECSATFRLDPSLNYVDVGRGMWVAAFPVQDMSDWRGAESKARAAFDDAFGASAPASAQELGAELAVRVVFGWAALREKIVCNEAGLDDIVVELTKLAMLRGLEQSPLRDDTELRVFATEGRDLVLFWLRSQDESAVERLVVPRDLYESIAGGQKGWEELREKLTAGQFVDMQRLMMPQADGGGS